MHVYTHKDADISLRKLEVVLNHSDRVDDRAEELKARAKRQRKKKSQGKVCLKKNEFSLYAYYHERKMFKHLPSAFKIHVIK